MCLDMRLWIKRLPEMDFLVKIKKIGITLVLNLTYKKSYGGHLTLKFKIWLKF